MRRIVWTMFCNLELTFSSTAYLASEASRYHTGDVIRVDGGYAIF